MSYEKRILDIGEKNNGYITNSLLTLNEIPTIYLTRMANKNILQKLDSGIYILNNFIDDDFYTYFLKYSKLIYSRTSALYLNGLYNKQLEYLEANFPYTYNISKIKKIRCHPICDWKYDLGIIEIETPAGNLVKTYDMERCICDLFVYNDLDNEGVKFAIERYKKVGINHDKLYEYAKKLGVYKELRAIFEVI